MSTVVKKLYEGLFLVDSGEAAADWNGINNVIEKTLARGDAEIVSAKKWDERRLAYDIDGKSRGTYILTYFRGDPAKIGAIERSVQLSEQIMRMLIIRTDKMSAEDMEKAPPAATTEVAAKPARADAKTRAVRASAAKTERRGRARAPKEAEAQKPERAKAKAAPRSSAKRSRGPRVRRKSAQDSKGTPPKSGQAKE